MHRSAEKRTRHREQRERPEERPREMSRAPELERADARDQNVEHQRRRPDRSRGQPGERHRRDVTRRTRVPDAGIEKRDYDDAEEEQGESRGRHWLREETPNVECSTSNGRTERMRLVLNVRCCGFDLRACISTA